MSIQCKVIDPGEGCTSVKLELLDMQLVRSLCKFVNHVKAMVSAFEVSGNPFNEGRQNLVTLDSKEVMSETAVTSIREVQTIAQSQYEM